MGTEQERTAAFLAGLDVRERSRLAGWSGPLSELVAAARSAWPGFDVPVEDFLGWVITRLPAGGQGPEALKGPELYLAFACARADAAALKAFSLHYLPEIDAALRRLRLTPQQHEELRQQVSLKLLVAEEGATPRIGTYEGRGDLRRWVRAVATREGLSLLREATPEVEMEAGFFDAFPTASEDLELQYARREYQGAFKRAFEEALATLTPEERNLLRRHFIDGLSAPRLAALQGLHRVTLFRKLRQVSEALVERTRELLLARLPMTAEEMASLDRLIRSHLDMSLERLLPPTEPD